MQCILLHVQLSKHLGQMFALKLPYLPQRFPDFGGSETIRLSGHMIALELPQYCPVSAGSGLINSMDEMLSLKLPRLPRIAPELRLRID